MVINTAKIPPSKVAPCTRFVEITSWRTTVKSPARLWVRTKSLVRAQALPPGQYCRRRLPMKPRWSAPIARLRFLWNMRSRALGRAPSEVASLAAPGTRAAGPWGRPWPPPECAPRAHSGGPAGPRRLPPRRAARIPSVPGFQFARLPPAPAPPPADRARRGRRRGEELKIWNPGNLRSPRTRGRIPGFQIPQLVDSRSLRATAAAGCASLMGDRARLKTLVQTPAADSHREGGEENLSLPHAPVHTRNPIGCRYTLTSWGQPSDRHAGRA